MQYKHALESVLDDLVEDSRSLWVPQDIREYNAKGNALQFLRDHVGQSVPCLWRGAANGWPALSKWNDHDQRYLRNKIGDTVVEVAWTPDGRADSIVDVISCDQTPQEVFAMPQRRSQKFGDMLSQLCCTEGTRRSCGEEHNNEVMEPGVPYYSAQDSCLTRNLPELVEDIDESVLNFASEAFGEDACATNIWCGDGRSVTTMHSDPFENMYAVVTGAKIFRLRPPSDAGVLCKPTLRCARWETAEEGHHSRDQRILRTKREYKGWQLVEQEGITNWIDESKIDERCGRELIVRVEAGDLLYLPALWFHHVSQRGLTIAVNWWFEMNFGRNWVYRELCFNLRGAIAASEEAAEDGEWTKAKH